MDAQSLHIDFIVPRGWHELTDAQLRYVYNLIVLDLDKFFPVERWSLIDASRFACKEPAI